MIPILAELDLLTAKILMNSVLESRALADDNIGNLKIARYKIDAAIERIEKDGVLRSPVYDNE